MLEGVWSQQLGQVCTEDGLGHNLQQHGLIHAPSHVCHSFDDQKQVFMYAEALSCALCPGWCVWAQSGSPQGRLSSIVRPESAF